MTGEEMERAIAFVLEQQARFEVQLAELARRQTESEGRVLKLENSMGLMREAVIGAMGLAQRVAEAQVEADRRAASLKERLDAFIVVVERYITRNGNGGQPKA